MRTKKNISLHSPKNAYRVEINYNHPIKEVGSVQSFGSNELEHCHNIASGMVRDARVGATIKILQNIATFPHFDWQVTEIYVVNEEGKRL